MKQKFNPSRRSFLSKPVKVIPAIAIAGTALGGVAATAQLPDLPETVALTSNRNNYVPTFFHDDEWAFMNAAVNILIPEDEYGPGAIKAGVPEFIDRQMQTPYGMGKLWYMTGPFDPDLMEQVPTLGYQLNMSPQQVYRLGIIAFDKWCKKNHQKVFSELDAQTQMLAMKTLSDQMVSFDNEDMPPNTFFKQLLSDTKQGFFADPMYGGNRNMVGWEMVGFTGARADFMDWIDHPNVAYPFGAVSITANKI